METEPRELAGCLLGEEEEGPRAGPADAAQGVAFYHLRGRQELIIRVEPFS